LDVFAQFDAHENVDGYVTYSEFLGFGETLFSSLCDSEEENIPFLHQNDDNTDNLYEPLNN
jgi:hypothetical protein